MKMAVRLNEFAEGLDAEITILDLKPRMKAELTEHALISHRNESPYIRKSVCPCDPPPVILPVNQVRPHAKSRAIGTQERPV